MGYLEAPLSLNPSDREPKTTIVTRVMLGTVLTTAAELARPPRRCGLSGARTLGFSEGWTSLTSHGCCPVATKPHLQQASPDIFSTSWSAHLSAANDPPLHYSITSSAMASNPGGMAMPSVLAVWRLMMNSNLTARITGRSAGFSPLSTRPA